MKYLNLLHLFSFLVTQSLITEPSEYDIMLNELKALKAKSISEELFIAPYVEKVPTTYQSFNILQKLELSNFLKIEPVGAIRYSNSQSDLPQYWLTPGLKIKSTIPLLNISESIWMYSWASFYKHSGIYDTNCCEPGHNIDDISLNPIQLGDLFTLDPNYSTSFFTRSIEPDGGLDFDQSQAGISILSKNFEFVFGKFNTSFGPSSRSNLSISKNIPPFEQLLIKIKHKKVIFSYVLGSLGSNMPKDVNFPEDSLYVDQWDLYENLWNNFVPVNGNLLDGDRIPVYQRYVAHHRLDFKINDKFRIGVYEQVIFGSRDIPMVYMIPILPFWSSQHETGDLDNLMLGCDFDLLLSNKENISNRIYASLLIDEWAPYSTFDKKNRNWFVYQLGYSRNGKLFNKDILFKTEYTRVEGRAYNHRFKINEPKHYGYNLGYWSGNHSDDFILNLLMLLDNYRFFKIAYEYTRFSNNTMEEIMLNLENQYNDNYENIDFLDGGYNYRGKFSLLYSMPLKYHLFFDLELSSFNTKGLYSDEDFQDITLKLRYNIPK